MAFLLMFAGCSKLTPAVDTHGFAEAFAEDVDGVNDSGSLQPASLALVQSVLEAIQQGQWEKARQELDQLRLQSDLSPRQRLETKSLHSLVGQQMEQKDNPKSAGAPSPIRV